MGYITEHKDKGVSLFDYFKKNVFDYEDDFIKSTLIKSYTYNIKQFYYLVEKLDKEKNITTFTGGVILINYLRKRAYNLQYRIISEDEGPNCFNCPTEIINKLSETTNQYSLHWRNRCLEENKRINENYVLPKKDVSIEFEKPLTYFHNGVRYEDKVFVRCHNRRQTYYPQSHPDCRVHISKRALQINKYQIGNDKEKIEKLLKELI
jgi:hypothetical protein